MPQHFTDFTIKARVIRTDEKASTFGQIAFSAEFRSASDEQIEEYMAGLAKGDPDTVGEFRIQIGLD